MMRFMFHITLWILVAVNSYAQQKIEIEIFNQENINTPFHEFSPVEWNDNMLYVSSHQDLEYKDKANQASFFDLKFAAKAYDGEMLRSASLPEMINSNFHEGPSSYHANSNTLYFTRSNYAKGKIKADLKKKVQLKLYKSIYNQGVWSSPEKLGFDQEGGSFCHPSISADGNLMVFASNQSGNMDLYYSKNLGGWTQPKRLGAHINSTANEWFPFLHPDGYLLFAKADSLGENGLDIYVSRLDGTSFSEAKKLPAPFNTEYDDFGVYINDEQMGGYISSNRPGGVGMDDIFRFAIDRPILETVMGEEELMISQTKKTKPATPKRIKSQTVAPKEEQIAKAPKSSVNKMPASERNSGSTATNSNINNNAAQIEKPVNVPTTKYQIGQIFTIHDVGYSYNTKTIRQQSVESLDKIADMMLDSPGMKIQLSTHTDARGSEQFNQALTDKKASEIQRYLMERGVARDRVFGIGFGESRLLNHCENEVNCSEEEHQANRRTEVKIIDL